MEQHGYKPLKELGQGAFGRVVMASKGGVNYAVKMTSKELIKDQPHL
jgi:hypothetical protein